MDTLLLFDFLQPSRRKRKRITEPRKDVFILYDEEKFKERFRLSKSTVQKLLDQASVYSCM